jgi:hypothetical protein
VNAADGHVEEVADDRVDPAAAVVEPDGLWSVAR